MASAEDENGEENFDFATQDKHLVGEKRREVTSLSASDSLEDVESKDLDTEKDKKPESNNDEGAGIADPEEVCFAREEISTLIAEEKRTSDLKAELQGKLQQTRKEVEALEELLPKKISSEENREILGLLCKVHELEITNAELQSNSLLRENLLRQKDLEMNKFESRQRLCDEIIQMQRVVINGKFLVVVTLYPKKNRKKTARSQSFSYSRTSLMNDYNFMVSSMFHCMRQAKSLLANQQ